MSLDAKAHRGLTVVVGPGKGAGGGPSGVPMAPGGPINNDNEQE